jgi:hypothetical protein
MAQKRANVKNEKQYEALKDKGNVKGASRADRKLARALRAGVAKSPGPAAARAGRDDGAEEGGRPQGRQGGGSQELKPVVEVMPGVGVEPTRTLRFRGF